MDYQDRTIIKLEKNINHALQLVNIGFFEYDVIKDRGSFSQKMYDLLGLDQNMVVTFNTVFELVHPDDANQFQSSYIHTITKGLPFFEKIRFILKGGQIRTLNNYVDVILNEDKQVVRLIGTSVDITEQELLQKQLEESRARMNDLANSLDVAIWSKDMKQKNMTFLSEGIVSICGYSVDDFLNDKITWEDLILEEDLPTYNSRHEKLLRGKIPKSIYRIRHKNGEIRWIHDETNPYYDDLGKILRLDGIAMDITEQKKLEEKLTYLANHDSLTGLANRRLFENELNDIFNHTSYKSHTKFAILILDLDGFKRINDTFGHLVGDQLLMKASKRVQECIPEHDIVARIGGDEFSILTKQYSNEEQLIAYANRIISTFQEPFFINGYEFYITTSIGIVTNQIHGDEPLELLKKADIALYNAKEAGKNNFQIYTPEMDKEFFKLYTLERDLRKAIKKNELLMHYQPIVDAMTGDMVGAESLIRWHHPERGMVSPGQFIPLAEENGMILEITDWTLRTVCNQINQWEKLGIPLFPISVNISPKRFLKNDWGEVFLHIILESKVNPKLLKLEITESALIYNEVNFLESIQKLKEIGVQISLDDFGTGYSSLFYLKNFLIDTLKIDQTFIRNFVNKDISIIKYIINLAHELKMKVVAEGVETEEQLNFLRNAGCDYIQGYYFFKPLPVEEFGEII